MSLGFLPVEEMSLSLCGLPNAWVPSCSAKDVRKNINMDYCEHLHQHCQAKPGK